MMIDTRRPVRGGKELKVRLPVGHHIKLHSLKVVHGDDISDMVSEALEVYFAQRLGDG